MNFEIVGTLHKIFDTENKSGSFQAREFVISLEGNYPQYVKFQLTQDKCGVIDKYKEGEKVKVFFDLRGREWQGKYFTNLNAWRVDKGEEGGGTGNDFPDFNEMPPSGFEEFDGGSVGGGGNLEELPF